MKFHKITISLIILGLLFNLYFIYKIFFVKDTSHSDGIVSSYRNGQEMRAGDFMFTLPKGWEVYGTLARVGNKILSGTIAYVPDKKNFGEEGTIFVNFFEEQTSQNLESWLETNVRQTAESLNGGFGRIENKEILGVKAISRSTQFKVLASSGVSLRTSKEYYFKVGDRIREFKAYTVSGSEGERLLSIFDQFISDLKLIGE